MKKYFAELEALGHKTIQALRAHDAGAASMLAKLQADVRAGFLTERGFANHRQAAAQAVGMVIHSESWKKKSVPTAIAIGTDPKIPKNIDLLGWLIPLA